MRVVQSNRSGVGKTLYKDRLAARLRQTYPREQLPLCITIPLHSREAHAEDIAACLLEHTLDPKAVVPRIIHLDVSYQVGCWSTIRPNCTTRLNWTNRADLDVSCFVDLHDSSKLDESCFYVPFC